jgi:hypothetical protein
MILLFIKILLYFAIAITYTIIGAKQFDDIKIKIVIIVISIFMSIGIFMVCLFTNSISV